MFYFQKFMDAVNKAKPCNQTSELYIMYQSLNATSFNDISDISLDDLIHTLEWGFNEYKDENYESIREINQFQLYLRKISPIIRRQRVL